jgi:hypothetical protein
MAALNMFDKKLTIFAEADLIFAAQTGEVSYYGYYAVDGRPNEFWNFGAQIEQVDADALIGPHVGFTLGFAHFEAQYYLGLDSHAFRVIAALNF